MKKSPQQQKTPINITEVLAQLSALAPTPTEADYKNLKKYRPHEWDNRRRTMLTQFIEDWQDGDPRAVESLLQELQAQPEKYDPEYLLKKLTTDPDDVVFLRLTSPEFYQRRLDHLEGLRSKWLQDPVKYLGESCGLVLEDLNKEIAHYQKQLAKAATDPGRLAALARNEKRAQRAREYGVIGGIKAGPVVHPLAAKRRPGRPRKTSSNS
jgi:hypothetical protein